MSICGDILLSCIWWTKSNLCTPLIIIYHHLNKLTNLNSSATLTLSSDKQDKGGGIVIFDCPTKAFRLLSDTHTYIKLSSDPLKGFQRSLKELIELGFSEGILNPHEKLFLYREFFSTPYFYYLPKESTRTHYIPLGGQLLLPWKASPAVYWITWMPFSSQ